MREVLENSRKNDKKPQTLFPDLNPYGNLGQHEQPAKIPQKTVASTKKPQTRQIKQRFSRIKFTKRLILKIMAVVLGIIAIVFMVNFYISLKQSFPPPLPLPQTTLNTLGFKVYYPSQMPKGYHYKNGSTTSHNGLLFYKFTNGNKTITVTEQVAPPKNIDISKIVEGYTAIKVSIGKASVGTSVGNPSAIILTDTTLINITSSKGVAKDQVTSLAQKMKLFEPAD